MFKLLIIDFFYIFPLFFRRTGQKISFEFFCLTVDKTDFIHRNYTRWLLPLFKMEL